MAAKKPPPPEPADERSREEVLRQALELDQEKVKQLLDQVAGPTKAALAEITRINADPALIRTLAVGEQMGSQIEATRQTIQKMLPGVLAAGETARQVEGILDLPGFRGAAQRYYGPSPVDSTHSISIEALKPREDPVLEVQRETAQVLGKVAGFQEQTLTAMDKQSEALQSVLKEAAEQTRLGARQMKVGWVMIAIGVASLIAYIVQMIVSLVS
jgi:hypothetical protein